MHTEIYDTPASARVLVGVLHFIVFRFTALQILGFVLFLQIEGKTLHQQKDYNSTAVVWDQTHNIWGRPV